MKYILTFIALSLFTVSSSSGKDGRSRLIPGETEDVITVNYCDLLRQPTLYDQKVVRIQAIYRYGFEWAELYCPECLTESRTWVEFEEGSERRTKSDVAKKISDHGFRGRTVRVLMVGKFYGSGGGYGHMNAYGSKFVVIRVERAKIILNDSPVPTAVPKKLLDRANCRLPQVKKKPRRH